MPSDRNNFVAVALGKQGTGKSTLLARFASLFPRRIVLDSAAEFSGVYPGAYDCTTYAQTLDALDDAAEKRQWIITACLMPSEVAKLCGILCSLRNPREGYSVAHSGVVLECGEMDAIAPNHMGIAPEIENVFNRGRHGLVSFLAASRRPAQIHRIVTSQAHVIMCFQQHEERDIEALAGVVGAANATHIAKLQLHHYLQYLPHTMKATIMDSESRVVEIL